MPPAKREKAPALKFCGECNNLLYPRSDNNAKRLFYQCRNCNYQEDAERDPESAPRVYRNDLLTVTREQRGETKDLETDPTLPFSDKVCPTCGKSGAVFFQDQGKRHTTNMTLFYVCVHCREVYRDEDTPEGKARLAAKKAKKDNKDTEATA